MAQHIVKCLYCGKTFDKREVEWVKPNGNRYAHKECAQKEELKKGIVLQIHEKMKSVLGAKYNKTKIDRQIKELTNQGKTVNGILQTLNYWYDVKGDDGSNAKGGIGIVEWIYGEALEYYERQKKYRQLGKIEDYIDDEVTYKIKPKPITKPVGVKLFNLR